MKETIYFIKNHSYAVSKTLPVVDGVILRSNFQISEAIRNLLGSVDYRFGLSRPYPPALHNYMIVERKVLVNMLRNLVIQIDSFPKSIYDLCTVGNCGFEISLPINKNISYRICRIEFRSNERVESHYCTINQIAELTSRFLHSNFTNKSVTIV